MPAPTIHILAPALPPAIDGIGDHSARLSAALVAAGAAVTLLGPTDVSTDPVPGVVTRPTFDPAIRRSVWRVVDAVTFDRPDWLLVQYNPFMYGRWGLNPWLPAAVDAVRRRSPTTRVAIFAHEQFTPLAGVKQTAMSTWQRWQFRRVGRAASVVFASIAARVPDNVRRFPGAAVVHMPVGSNVPREPIGRDEARRRLGVADGEGVIGIFGTAHNSRLLTPVGHAIDATAAAGLRPRLLYIGPHGAAVRAALGDRPVIDGGPLSVAEVSRRLAAIDVYLGGFVDGISTRRTSFLAALDHGLACVGTTGENTDPVFTAAAAARTLRLTDSSDPHGFDGPVVELLSDSTERARMGAAASDLSARYFTWPALAGQLLAALDCAPKERSA